VRLAFQGGTITIHAPREAATELPPSAVWDPREAVHRVRAVDYASLVMALRANKVEYTDDARAYAEVPFVPRAMRAPFQHQREAIEAWLKAGSRGVVVLPTGAGKTFVATLALALKKRSALIVVPTLDLMSQWHDVLRANFAGVSGTFDVPIGLVGGGYHEVTDLTITTYDSAYLHMDRLGNRFGLVVFDECHHLPSEAYATAARMCLAPFRLGLTATPERTDGKEALYAELVGETVYRRDIDQLRGHYLAEYETIRLEVALSDEERAEYDAARATYVGFIRRMGIDMSKPDGWGRFLMLSSQSDVGRRAFEAYRRQKQIALAAPGKLALLERLLETHRKDRVLIFTEDNATVHQISRSLLLPAITHETRVKERARILSLFNAEPASADGGDAPGTEEAESLFAIVTSKVLNEGVNVPAANIAIVLSGNGSVREHVQRLGRILRKHGDKRATLYELVAAGTAEKRTSDKRRDHVAYSR
jgi:superfamily II DNA or RNA helicase